MAELELMTAMDQPWISHGSAMGTVLLCLSSKQCDKESGIWSIL